MYDVMATPLKDSVTKQVVNSEETAVKEVTVDGSSFTKVSRHLDPANGFQPANFCNSATKLGSSTSVKKAVDDKSVVPSEAEPSSSLSSRRREALLPKVPLSHPEAITDHLAKPVRQPKHPIHRYVRDHPDNHAHLKIKSSLRRECRNAASIATNFVLCSHICTML
uniref:TPX2_importin domain-containing protein n=1 Tax=Panagrellus redivivus TaxID=6233 RepID=A0A7E4VSP4_PANRE